MHNNPVVKKWALCNNQIEYKHSSAKFYLTGEQGFYPITNFMEMEDVALMRIQVCPDSTPRPLTGDVVGKSN